MSDHFADRLIKAIRAKNAPVCVGLDPVYSQLPAAIREKPDFNDEADSEASLDAVLEFSRSVIRIVAPMVPAIKINTAYFERYYGEGIDAYFELIQEAAQAGLVVIGDSKRGDVGHTAEQYAQSQLSDPMFDNLDHLVAPDAVTVSSYLGLDGIKPFLSVAREQAKGVFAMVLTSNESAAEIQGFKNAQGETLSEHVGRQVDTWGRDDGLIGNSGYSCLGAVVAPRHVEVAKKLRGLMPQSIFLVPGYGAQGLPVADIRHCFNADGQGALVSASRSVIFAYEKPEYQEQCGDHWEKCVELACRNFVNEIRSACK